MICIVRVQVDYTRNKLLERSKRKERKKERTRDTLYTFGFYRRETIFYASLTFHCPYPVVDRIVESCVFSSLSLNNQALVIQKRKIHVIISCFTLERIMIEHD